MFFGSLEKSTLLDMVICIARMISCLYPLMNYIKRMTGNMALKSALAIMYSVCTVYAKLGFAAKSLMLIMCKQKPLDPWVSF
jgi:hypothetical protein